MSNTITQLRQIIKTNPSLIWHTHNHNNLDQNAIVEAVLNHGTWQQVQQIQSILGLSALKQAFTQLTSHSRSNFRQSTHNYFSHYLQAHA